MSETKTLLNDVNKLFDEESSPLIVTPLKPCQRPLLSVRQRRIAEFCLREARRRRRRCVNPSANRSVRAKVFTAAPVKPALGYCRVCNPELSIVFPTTLRQASRVQSPCPCNEEQLSTLSSGVKVLFRSPNVWFSESDVAALSSESSRTVDPLERSSSAPIVRKSSSWGSELSSKSESQDEEVPVPREVQTNTSNEAQDRYVMAPTLGRKSSKVTSSTSCDLNQPHGQVWHSLWKHMSRVSTNSEECEFAQKGSVKVRGVNTEDECLKKKSTVCVNNIWSVRNMQLRKFHQRFNSAASKFPCRSKFVSQSYRRRVHQRSVEPSSTYVAKRKALRMEDGDVAVGPDTSFAKTRHRELIRCRKPNEVPRVLITSATGSVSAGPFDKPGHDLETKRRGGVYKFSAHPSSAPDEGNIDGNHNKSSNASRSSKLNNHSNRPRLSVPLKASRVSLETFYKKTYGPPQLPAKQPANASKLSPNSYKAQSSIQKPIIVDERMCPANNFNQLTVPCSFVSKPSTQMTSQKRNRISCTRGTKRLYSPVFYHQPITSSSGDESKRHHLSPKDNVSSAFVDMDTTTSSLTQPMHPFSVPHPVTKPQHLARLSPHGAQRKSHFSHLASWQASEYPYGLPYDSTVPFVFGSSYQDIEDRPHTSSFRRTNAIRGSANVGVLPTCREEVSALADGQFDARASCDLQQTTIRFSHPNAPDVLISPPPNSQRYHDSLDANQLTSDAKPPTVSVMNDPNIPSEFNAYLPPLSDPLVEMADSQVVQIEEDFITQVPLSLDMFLKSNITPSHFMPFVDFSRVQSPPSPLPRETDSCDIQPDVQHYKQPINDGEMLSTSILPVRRTVPVFSTSPSYGNDRKPTKNLLTFSAQVPSLEFLPSSRRTSAYLSVPSPSVNQQLSITSLNIVNESSFDGSNSSQGKPCTDRKSFPLVEDSDSSASPLENRGTRTIDPKSDIGTVFQEEKNQCGRKSVSSFADHAVRNLPPLESGLQENNGYPSPVVLDDVAVEETRSSGLYLNSQYIIHDNKEKNFAETNVSKAKLRKASYDSFGEKSRQGLLDVDLPITLEIPQGEMQRENVQVQVNGPSLPSTYLFDFKRETGQASRDSCENSTKTEANSRIFADVMKDSSGGTLMGHGANSNVCSGQANELSNVTPSLKPTSGQSPFKERISEGGFVNKDLTLQRSRVDPIGSISEETIQDKGFKDNSVNYSKLSMETVHDLNALFRSLVARVQTMYLPPFSKSTNFLESCDKDVKQRSSSLNPTQTVAMSVECEENSQPAPDINIPLTNLQKESLKFKYEPLQVPTVACQSTETDAYLFGKTLPLSSLSVRLLESVIDVPPVIKETENVGTCTESHTLPNKADSSQNAECVHDEKADCGDTSVARNDQETEYKPLILHQCCSTTSLKVNESRGDQTELTNPPGVSISSPPSDVYNNRENACRAKSVEHLSPSTSLCVNVETSCGEYPGRDIIHQKLPLSVSQDQLKNLKPFFRSRSPELVNICSLAAIHSIPSLDEEVSKIPFFVGKATLEKRFEKHHLSHDDDEGPSPCIHEHARRIAKAHGYDRRVSFRAFKRGSDHQCEVVNNREDCSSCNSLSGQDDRTKLHRIFDGKPVHGRSNFKDHENDGVNSPSYLNELRRLTGCTKIANSQGIFPRSSSIPIPNMSRIPTKLLVPIDVKKDISSSTNIKKSAASMHKSFVRWAEKSDLKPFIWSDNRQFTNECNGVFEGAPVDDNDGKMLKGTSCSTYKEMGETNNFLKSTKLSTDGRLPVYAEALHRKPSRHSLKGSMMTIKRRGILKNCVQASGTSKSSDVWHPLVEPGLNHMITPHPTTTCASKLQKHESQTETKEKFEKSFLEGASSLDVTEVGLQGTKNVCSAVSRKKVKYLLRPPNIFTVDAENQAKTAKIRADIHSLKDGHNPSDNEISSLKNDRVRWYLDSPDGKEDPLQDFGGYDCKANHRSLPSVRFKSANEIVKEEKNDVAPYYPNNPMDDPVNARDPSPFEKGKVYLDKSTSSPDLAIEFADLDLVSYLKSESGCAIKAMKRCMKSYTSQLSQTQQYFRGVYRDCTSVCPYENCLCPVGPTISAASHKCHVLEDPSHSKRVPSDVELSYCPECEALLYCGRNDCEVPYQCTTKSAGIAVFQPEFSDPIELPDLMASRKLNESNATVNENPHCICMNSNVDPSGSQNNVCPDPDQKTSSHLTREKHGWSTKFFRKHKNLVKCFTSKVSRQPRTADKINNMQDTLKRPQSGTGHGNKRNISEGLSSLRYLMDNVVDYSETSAGSHFNRTSQTLLPETKTIVRSCGNCDQFDDVVPVESHTSGAKHRCIHSIPVEDIIPVIQPYPRYVMVYPTHPENTFTSKPNLRARASVVRCPHSVPILHSNEDCVTRCSNCSSGDLQRMHEHVLVSKPKRTDSTSRRFQKGWDSKARRNLHHKRLGDVPNTGYESDGLMLVTEDNRHDFESDLLSDDYHPTKNFACIHTEPMYSS